MPFFFDNDDDYIADAIQRYTPSAGTSSNSYYGYVPSSPSAYGHSTVHSTYSPSYHSTSVPSSPAGQGYRPYHGLSTRPAASGGGSLSSGRDYVPSTISSSSTRSTNLSSYSLSPRSTNSTLRTGTGMPKSYQSPSRSHSQLRNYHHKRASSGSDSTLNVGGSSSSLNHGASTTRYCGGGALLVPYSGSKSATLLDSASPPYSPHTHAHERTGRENGLHHSGSSLSLGGYGDLGSSLSLGRAYGGGCGASGNGLLLSVYSEGPVSQRGGAASAYSSRSSSAASLHNTGYTGSYETARYGSSSVRYSDPTGSGRDPTTQSYSAGAGGAAYSRTFTSASIDSDRGGIDYKKLYEKEKLENERLKKDMERLKQEMQDLKYSLEKAQSKQDTRSSDTREKRTLERKISEYEEELKAMKALEQDNTRLKEENGALIRVISKLSK